MIYIKPLVRTYALYEDNKRLGYKPFKTYDEALYKLTQLNELKKLRDITERPTTLGDLSEIDLGL